MSLTVSQYRIVPNSNPPSIQALVVDSTTNVTTWVDGRVAMQIAQVQEITALRLMLAEAYDIDYIDPADIE